MLLVDDLAAGGTKNLRHTPRGLVTLLMKVESIAECSPWFHCMFNSEILVKISVPIQATN